MSKILIFKENYPFGEYDIKQPTDYLSIKHSIDVNYHGHCPNFGNRLWLQGIYSEIDTDNNELIILTKEMTIDYINSQFDIILLPMANIFYVGYISAIERMADIFEKIKVPTYVIACGVQAESYDQLNDLVSALKESATRFIRAIYSTGGEFALRGYFSKEFFSKLGFNSAIVTGCPSLFQNGPDLHINKQSTDSLRTVFNGTISLVDHHLKNQSQSIFVDQGFFYPVLDRFYYNPNLLTKKEMRAFVNKYGKDCIDYVSQNKVKLFFGMPEWRSFLIDNRYNFSVGSRIHGNIMSLLCDIPSCVISTDTRTKEMAEFFDIPTGGKEDIKDINKLYDNCNFSDFNNHFKERYIQFEQFLQKIGMVKRLNSDNRFWNMLGTDAYNEKNNAVFNNHIIEYSKMKNYLSYYDSYQKGIKQIMRLKSKIIKKTRTGKLYDN